MDKKPTSSLDVSEIMDAIRAEIQEKGLRSETLSFADVPLEPETTPTDPRFDTDILRGDVRKMLENSARIADTALTGNVLVRLIKRMVQRLTRFYFDPLFREQSEWNGTAADACAQMENYIRESRMTGIRALTERVEVLEMQQKNAKRLIERQQAQIESLEARLNGEGKS